MRKFEIKEPHSINTSTIFELLEEYPEDPDLETWAEECDLGDVYIIPDAVVTCVSTKSF